MFLGGLFLASRKRLDSLNPSPTLGVRACRFRLHGGWYGTFEMEKLSPKDKAMEAGVV